ncbi:hypothetical protein Ga0466249_004766 [Sporomusaceae bacterium BoRhaA]|uniref:FxLYD domain-containing protein n=1 Tax=Pelorhabdus rhamnosifermentans TaxID=2772457 RepID=UPI001C0631F3|nr:FxLYD domain-containing protein [Pelorhabdus rhamnosifermentans]MBU2703621.1 hypothetical protein [Pelorhabdus rhamnosifermentans]
MVQQETIQIRNTVMRKYLLVDDDGNQVGSTLANVNNLEPHGQWKFKAVVLNDNVKKYKIAEINGF